MSDELNGVRVAFLVSSAGVEQVELTRPWQSVVDAGGEPVLIAPETGQVQAFNDDVEMGGAFTADLAVGRGKAEDPAEVVVAGRSWVDEESLSCLTSAWNPTTSRDPDDLDAFCSTLVQQLAEAPR